MMPNDEQHNKQFSRSSSNALSLLLNPDDNQKTNLLVIGTLLPIIAIVSFSIPYQIIPTAYGVDGNHWINWISEIFLAVWIILWSLMAIFSSFFLRRAVVYQWMLFVGETCFGLLAVNTGFHLTMYANPNSLWITVGIVVLTILSGARKATLISDELEIARKNKWIDNNLDEENWAWHSSRDNICRRIPPEEARKKDEIQKKLLSLMPLVHLLTTPIKKDHALAGPVFLILGGIIMQNAFERLGYIQQFKKWEQEKGQPLLLREAFESKNSAAKKENELNIY